MRPYFFGKISEGVGGRGGGPADPLDPPLNYTMIQTLFLVTLFSFSLNANNCIATL